MTSESGDALSVVESWRKHKGWIPTGWPATIPEQARGHPGRNREEKRMQAPVDDYVLFIVGMVVFGIALAGVFALLGRMHTD